MGSAGGCATSRARCRAADALARTTEKHLTLTFVSGQRRGTLELEACFVEATEFEEQISSRCREQMILGKRLVARQLIDQRQAGLRSARHADGNRLVQPHDRRGQDPPKAFV